MQFSTGVPRSRVLLIQVVLQGSQRGQQHPKFGEQIVSCILRSFVNFALHLSQHTRSSGVTSGDLGSSNVGKHSEIDTDVHTNLFFSQRLIITPKKIMTFPPESLCTTRPTITEVCRSNFPKPLFMFPVHCLQ